MKLVIKLASRNDENHSKLSTAAHGLRIRRCFSLLSDRTRFSQKVGRAIVKEYRRSNGEVVAVNVASSREGRFVEKIHERLSSRHRGILYPTGHSSGRCTPDSFTRARFLRRGARYCSSLRAPFRGEFSAESNFRET